MAPTSEMKTKRISDKLSVNHKKQTQNTKNLTRKRIHVASHQSQPNPLRSSRLSSMTPVSHEEPPPLLISEKDTSATSPIDIPSPQVSKPEIYHQHHYKLLGHSKTQWVMGVDGCSTKWKRIYDPVNGKSCHQCRQKTLGLRTRCSGCNSVRGQLCGDCLYSRYGENVTEANQDPSWICPVCRGICNCSCCRKANGWVPTGDLYRKAVGFGYKSVAHYLIQTCMCENGQQHQMEDENEEQEMEDEEEEAVDLSAD